MTQPVAIIRLGPNTTARSPWGLRIGGVLAARFATLAGAKQGGRELFGVERWERVSRWYYREAI